MTFPLHPVIDQLGNTGLESNVVRCPGNATTAKAAPRTAEVAVSATSASQTQQKVAEERKLRVPVRFLLQRYS